jgi:uncharacterized protein (TIGR03437 family)
VNNASFAPFGHTNGGVAQGSVVAIFGAGLGPADLVQATSYPLGKELGGVSVRATAGAASVDLWPLYVSSTQIGALLPSSAPLGTARFTVTYRGQTSAPEEADVVRRNFGAFTVSAMGAGPASATNFISETNQPLNTLFTPARPGQVVTIWGTGLGPVSGDEAAGPLPGNMTFPLQVVAGGKTARVLYQGRSGCCAGIDQIAFEVPQEIEGCAVPVVIRAGTMARVGQPPPAEGAVTATATLAVASSGETCSDPVGLRSDELRLLQSRGNIRVAWLWLEKWPSGASARMTFAELTPGSLLGRIGLLGLPSPASCLEAYVDAGGYDYPVAKGLDAGPELMITGAGGSALLKLQGAGRYTAGGVNLGRGSYTLQNGQGGKDVGPFSATFELKDQPVWKNSAGVPATVPFYEWTGGDPEGLAVVHVEITNDVAQDLVLCAAPATLGYFSVGSVFIDSTLPTARFGTASVDEGFGVLSPFRFTAPGLDVGLIATVQFYYRFSTYK